jgi:hypothetical protein
MLHQVIFQKLLGEIDYGASGDFSGAGCVRDGAVGLRLSLRSGAVGAVGSAAPRRMTSMKSHRGERSCMLCQKGTTGGDYKTRISPGVGPGSGARRPQATTVTDEALSTSRPVAQHQMDLRREQDCMRGPDRIPQRHAMCADLGLCWLLSSYNLSGIWTWNTHGTDWIYQVRHS